jgi:hypothetical protein
MATTPAPRGLGNRGRDRIRESLGSPTEAPYADSNLYGNNPRPAQPLTTGWVHIDSSRIRAYEYDYSAQELRVRFVKYDTPWIYEGVSSALYEAFASSPSKGKFVNSTLNYTKYRQATPGEATHWPV